jgi:hypothetical protein
MALKNNKNPNQGNKLLLKRNHKPGYLLKAEQIPWAGFRS